MRLIFVWECPKYNVDLENSKKIAEKSFCFRDKCIWICCVKLPLLRREYLLSAINVLTNSFKIFHVTKRDSFQLNYLNSCQWIWERSCRWHWNSVLTSLPRCLSAGHLKRDFLHIYLTTSFRVRKFRNT